MTRAPNGAEYTTPVTLADGTRATLRAWWDAKRGVGGYLIEHADGTLENDPLMPLDAKRWGDEMRALLARGECGDG